MQDTRKPQDENRYSSGGPAGAGASSTTQLKAIQTEIHSKNVELQEINRQKYVPSASSPTLTHRL